MATFAKPENALKRADDLIAVGQKDHALQTLHDVITSRRHRTWSKVLEDIMKKYVQLCVDLRKGKYVKEGLHQYKLICQQVNVNSLEVVIKHFLQTAEGYAKEAQSKAKQTILDIEDLEVEESAESLILTAVSGEDRTDRTDREIVTPWLRFLWETYRTILETLRNSAKLEGLYHETAQLAFNFCLRYQRKNEFRRLSDILRNHLSNLNKYPNQPQTINLNNPETLQVHLETRFAQLNVATELELWQEAFRSVEDIHGLMTMAHKPLTAAMMATYFQKLARIFWVSNNYLFHAYAWFKYFSIARTTLKEKPEEFRTMASSVLLAALSIPLPDPKPADEQYFEYDLQKEKNLRMGSLLGFSISPKRDYLLQDLMSKKVTQIVFPELQDIYAILEKRFNPLQLCQKMTEKFEFIRGVPELAQYESQLQKLTFVRLLQQLSQVYSSMKIADFRKMVSFMSSEEIEKLLVTYAKRRFAGVRIDHQNGAIHFGGNDHSSDQIRDQLTNLARGLQDAAKLIQPKLPSQEEEAKIKNKREAFVRIINSLKEESARLLARTKIVEMRRAQEEHKAKLQALDQKAREEKEKARRRADEEKKAKHDAQKREKARAKQAEKAKEEETKQKVIQQLGIEPAAAAAIPNPEAFIEQRLATIQKAKRDQELKIVNLAKELAHRERAQREYERTLLIDQLSKKKKEDEEHYNTLHTKAIQAQRQQHIIELEEKKRLTRMASARTVFEARVMGERRRIYEAAKAEQDARIAEIQREREEERLRVQREEEERKRQIEEDRRAAEERERQRKLAEEQKKVEEENRKKKLQEQAELQRKRDEETLKKRREEDDLERKRREEQRLKEEDERKEAERSTWRKQESTGPPADRWGGGRGGDRPPAGGDRPPAGGDRWGRREDERPRFGEREPPRGGDRWGRDEPPRGRDEFPRGREEPIRGREEIPRGREEIPRGREEIPRGREEIPRGREEVPRGREEIPRGREEIPRGREEIPRGREEIPRGREEIPRGRDEPPRGGDRWGREEPPRGGDRWGRDEAPRGGGGDRWGREEAPRGGGGDRWGGGREEAPRGGGDRWASRDAPPRRDEPRRDEPVRRDEPRRDEPVRRDESRRDEPVRRDESRRDEPVRRDEPRRDEPRRPEREERPREERREERPSREVESRAAPAWGKPKDDQESWRKPPPPEEKQPEKRPERKEPERKPEREAKRVEEKEKEAPKEEPKPAKEDDGFNVVSKRRGKK